MEAAGVAGCCGVIPNDCNVLINLSTIRFSASADRVAPVSSRGGGCCDDAADC